ncbi:unnamed protein product [Polarella glacialis]|uniref:Uncharacterized protein n=1 Tax=Polarella glacialis TaxID=89957 RepID=A0A813ITP8_POLGL|nr:unnamed protein product [Polarella glacialis]
MSDLTEQETTDSTNWCIASITCFATLSVIPGLNFGIKTISQTAVLVGNSLPLTVFFLDAAWILLNVMVQSLVSPSAHHRDWLLLRCFRVAGKLSLGWSMPSQL